MRLLSICYISLIALSLVGCENIGEEIRCDTVYETTEDTTSEYGINLKASSNMHITLKKMDKFYKEMEVCSNLTAVPPTVWYISFDFFNIGGSWGYYHSATNTILMNTDVNIVERSCLSDEQTFKHESIHHILKMNGYDYSHSSPMFEKCAVGVNVCNGKVCD